MGASGLRRRTSAATNTFRTRSIQLARIAAAGEIGWLRTANSHACRVFTIENCVWMAQATHFMELGGLVNDRLRAVMLPPADVPYADCAAKRRLRCKPTALAHYRQVPRGPHLLIVVRESGGRRGTRNESMISAAFTRGRRARSSMKSRGHHDPRQRNPFIDPLSGGVSPYGYSTEPTPIAHQTDSRLARTGAARAAAPRGPGRRRLTFRNVVFTA